MKQDGNETKLNFFNWYLTIFEYKVSAFAYFSGSMNIVKT